MAFPTLEQRYNYCMQVCIPHRAQKARALLRYSSFSVGEINTGEAMVCCTICGYLSESSFSFGELQVRPLRGGAAWATGIPVNTIHETLKKK